MAKEEVKKVSKDKKSKNEKSIIKEKVNKANTDVSKKATKNSIKEPTKKVTKKTPKKSDGKTKKVEMDKDILETTSNDTKNKTTRTKKSSTKSNSTKKSTSKKMLSEYYDLPYRYNQTIVKILAQTPTTLFVYWDISDEDRISLMNTHGENFFFETRPVLVVHNLTKNYSFEIEINDFANSWYIRTQEPNCDYVIELGRRVNKHEGEYIYINSSNDIISPNDHILFENANLGNVLFRDIKTNKLSSKDFGSLRFINDIDKLYGNIYDVYSTLYNDEILNELTNPSSGEFLKK